MRAVGLLAAVLGALMWPALVLTHQSKREQVAERVLDTSLTLPQTLDPCSLPDLVHGIGKLTGVPTGVERVPGPCVRQPPSQTDRISLLGRTMGETMDILTKLDPRYRWLEADGVIVVRPLDAWNNREHFLHRSVDFVHDDLNVGGALFAINAAMGPPPLSSWMEMDTFKAQSANTRGGDQRFSIDLKATSVVEVLDEIVRTHGAMWWDVDYCQPQVRREFAWIEFQTFDGSGLKGIGVMSTDAAGERFSPCKEPHRLPDQRRPPVV